MPIEQLRSDLARLRAEIDALDDGDAESLERLQALAERVHHELDEQDGLADPAGLINELEDAVSRFEATHPVIGAHLNNLIVLLGSMGV